MTDDPDLPGLDALPPADQAAIGATLGALLAGFAGRDVAALAQVYAEDADWVNAFGTVKRGRAAILAYLQALFADANFRAGRPAAPPQSRLRLIGSDVVAVSVRMRIADQGLAGGGTIPLRDNHSLHILQRQPDGGWRIVSEIYMDARIDGASTRDG